MEITDILGHVWNVDCIGCAIAATTMNPPGGIIAENDSFYVHQDPEIPIIGFLIIASKRHIQSIVDLTQKEYVDFSSLLLHSRSLLSLLPNIQSITLVQEEHSTHFHLWLFPWYDWMIEKCGGKSLTHIRSIMACAKTAFNTPLQMQLILNGIECLKNAKTGNLITDE